LRAICDEHGILLIFDEVQSGVGRTGKMWACEYSGVKPDILTSAKGLGSGLPIGAVIAKKRYMEQWKRGAHGNTFGGNPLSCGAAIATLDLVQSEYAANAAKMGDYFMGKLRALQGEFRCIGEVRGRGLMIGMELIEEDADRTPARALVERLVRRGFHNGVLLLSCGVSTVRFMPPLCVTQGEIDEVVDILRISLGEALAGKDS
jgi:4-aminobutyrate aminotransferase